MLTGYDTIYVGRQDETFETGGNLPGKMSRDGRQTLVYQHLWAMLPDEVGQFGERFLITLKNVLFVQTTKFFNFSNQWRSHPPTPPGTTHEIHENPKTFLGGVGGIDV